MAFPSNCDPRVISIDPANGTMTRASITAMTPQAFEDQGYKEVYMDRVIDRSREARMAGYIEKSLEMLVNGITGPLKSPLGKAPLTKNESVILPYFYRQQRTNVNSNWWKVQAGAAHPQAGSGGIPASAWRITIRNSGSTFGTTLTQLQRYFLVGKRLIVDHVNSSTKAGYQAQFDIIASSNADSGGTAQAYVDVVPNVTASAFAGYSSTAKLPWQPTAGVAFILANTVSDFESYNQNETSNNNRKLLTTWLQRSRFVHEYTDEYLKALQASLTSGYFKNFRQLPLAEQKVQQYKLYIQSRLNTFFYGQRINENQTVETYTSLPQVPDPNNPELVLEYKSNTEGVRTLLSNCGRIIDHQGNSLNMDTVISTGYLIKRAREATGGSVDNIDVIVPREVSGLVLENFTTFYKAKYGIETQRHYMVGQELNYEKEVYLRHNSYEIPDDLGGYRLNVFADDYFSDRIAAAQASGTDHVNRARSVWMIDWTDFALEIGDMQMVKRETNILDNLYNYIIKPNIKHVMLESELYAVTAQDLNRSHMWENFNSTVSGPS